MKKEFNEKIDVVGDIVITLIYTLSNVNPKSNMAYGNVVFIKEIIYKEYL